MFLGRLLGFVPAPEKADTAPPATAHGQPAPASEGSGADSPSSKTALASDDTRVLSPGIPAAAGQPAPTALPPAWSHPGAVRPSYGYLGDHRGLVVLEDGSRIVVDTRDLSVAPSLIVFGYWERWIDVAVRRLVRPGNVAVDLGANFGYYTLTMAHAVGPHGKVHAFEANPHLAGLLRDTIAINGLSDRVTLRNAAVLDRNAPVELTVDPRYLGGGSVDVGYPATPTERYRVEGTTLCDALPGLGQLDLLRMDIEGSEPLALRGAESMIRNSPGLTIVSEWSVPMMSARCDVAELVRWLEEFGFGFWQIRVDSVLEPVPPSGLLSLPHCDVVISRGSPRES